MDGSRAFIRTNAHLQQFSPDDHVSYTRYYENTFNLLPTMYTTEKLERATNANFTVI
jgi:uncharacterized protein (UPF0276 family)